MEVRFLRRYGNAGLCGVSSVRTFVVRAWWEKGWGGTEVADHAAGGAFVLCAAFLSYCCPRPVPGGLLPPGYRPIEGHHQGKPRGHATSQRHAVT